MRSNVVGLPDIEISKLKLNETRARGPGAWTFVNSIAKNQL